MPEPSNERPLTFAWVINGDEGYGVRRGILTLTATLARRGHTPIVLSFLDGPLTEDLRLAGREVIVLGDRKAPNLIGGVLSKPKQALALWKFQRRLSKRIVEVLSGRGVDVLHIRRPSHVSIAGHAGRKLGCPTMWQMPDPISTRYPFGLNKKLYHRACVRLNVLPIANSAYTARTLMPGPAEVEMLHLAIEPDHWDPARVDQVTRKELGIDGTWITFSIFGRLGNLEKGQIPFLEAMLSIEDPPAPLCLLVVGGPTDGPVAARLGEIAERHGASDRVILTGFVDDPQRYYGVTDIAVNSRVDAEAFGHSVIEALMMGSPVLAHALGGPAETVTDGKTGWLAPDPSVQTFAATIRRALADRDRWPEMGATARAEALERFSIERYADRYLALVRSRLAKTRN